MKSRLSTVFSAILIVLLLCGCKSFSAGVPKGFTGVWDCDEYASDGKTDTGFYKMRIENNGEFSIYDTAAGNPGISGLMGNYTENTVECRFDMDDFDVPFCWTINSSKATFDYELKSDTLRLGHNGVWMVFHHANDEDETDTLMPETIDSLIALNIPTEFSFDMEYPYGGEDGKPIVEKSYTSEEKGYFSVGIFSFRGWDCLGDVNSTIDLDGYIDRLDKKETVTVGGENGYFGTSESDDMPDMVAVIYVTHGDYVFEFRLSNYDEQVTAEQINEFKKIVTSAKFKY